MDPTSEMIQVKMESKVDVAAIAVPLDAGDDDDDDADDENLTDAEDGWVGSFLSSSFWARRRRVCLLLDNTVKDDENDLEEDSADKRR